MNNTAIVSPRAFLTYLNNGQCPGLPQVKYSLMLYDYTLYKWLRDKYRAEKVGGFTTSCALINRKLLLCCGFGIGSPAAVAATEELIAAGIKRIVSFGTAGGIAPDAGLGDVMVCIGALKDEGTSAHYIPEGSYSYPAPALATEIEGHLRKEFPDLKTGKTWTTDAPYRETSGKVLRFRDEGIETVEMEVSALFTLGSFRNVEVAAVLVTGDLVTPQGWIPGFRMEQIGRTLELAVSTLIDALAEI